MEVGEYLHDAHQYGLRQSLADHGLDYEDNGHACITEMTPEVRDLTLIWLDAMRKQHKPNDRYLNKMVMVIGVDSDTVLAAYLYDGTSFHVIQCHRRTA